MRMNLQRDPVTGSIIPVLEQQQDELRWHNRTQSVVAGLGRADPERLCQELYTFLDQESRGQSGRRPALPLCTHAPDSYLSDHTLLTSAIVYCLGFGNKDVDVHLLRFAALSHEFPAVVRDVLSAAMDTTVAVFLRQAWSVLHEQGNQLVEAMADGDTLRRFAHFQPQHAEIGLNLLWYAHITASQPLYNRTLTAPNGDILYVISGRADFDQHPLNLLPTELQKVRLVHGGATKIKGYVFESAKLPEMRGASALLDRINQVDSRGFFRDAPECIIYANGGDLLALAPADTEQSVVDELEACYAQQTLTAQSVFVDNVYTLLELQYGLQPTKFWVDDYEARLQAITHEQQQLLRVYYGEPERQEQPGWTDRLLFHLRKGFGECTTQLALKRTWRRDGNTSAGQVQGERMARRLPNFETTPFGQYCSSCDRRMAVVRVPDLNDALCESCLRKRWIGWYMRHEDKEYSDLFQALTEWKPRLIETAQPNDNVAEVFRPWHRQFETYLAASGGELVSRYWHEVRDATSAWVDMPENIDQIGQAAKPEGYVGLVYADGNNVGALIEKIRTAGFYRQFATRLFYATQAAVFDALATHVMATEVRDEQGNPLTIHPFEIVNIGGDDLFLIVPAQSALPIAQHIAAYIEQLFSDRETTYQEKSQAVQRYRPEEDIPSGRPRISMAAGVVLADCHLPIFFLLDLVEELLKSAKKGAKDRKKQCYWGGVIDFMSMKATGMVASEIRDFRQAALTHDQPYSNDRLHLTARPYTTHEVQGLLKTIATLRAAAFPRTQLHLLRELLPQGRFASSLSYLYYSSRLTGRRDSTSDARSASEQAITLQAQLRNNLDQAWYNPSQDPIPWRLRVGAEIDRGHSDGKNHWETILADLIELYDFMPESTTETEERSG